MIFGISKGKGVCSDSTERDSGSGDVRNAAHNQPTMLLKFQTAEPHPPSILLGSQYGVTKYGESSRVSDTQQATVTTFFARLEAVSSVKNPFSSSSEVLRKISERKIKIHGYSLHKLYHCDLTIPS